MRAARATVLAALLTLALAAPAAATPGLHGRVYGRSPAGRLWGPRSSPRLSWRGRLYPVHGRPHRLHRVSARPRVPGGAASASDLRSPRSRTSTGGNAVSVGDDGVRSYEEEDRDIGDGRNIFVVKITDHKVPDKVRRSPCSSLPSVHGNERGGLEGGAPHGRGPGHRGGATGGTINDGVENYSKTTTGKTPEFHEYEVKRRPQERGRVPAS